MTLRESGFNVLVPGCYSDQSDHLWWHKWQYDINGR